jgi:hypothetical protein
MDTQLDITPSEEQTKIIDSIQNKSVVVNSVAGAGKTTTLIFIATSNKNKKILQITYNKQLKLEVRNKMKKYNIENVEIHTYHSVAVKYYDPKCFTDDGIINILEKDIPPQKTPYYDIIVIDEVQDMTPNYYELVYKFMTDINFKSNVLVLGDENQGVYEFKNADTRFLTLSHKIWKSSNFDKLTLNQSYRVTKQIAWFVNNVMLGYNRIISHKESKHKVYYYKKSIYNIHSQIFTKIKNFFKLGYKPEDIFVLSPTLRNANNPIKKLENILVKNNIPVYFSRNEEEGIDEKIIAGKTVFTTYHQSKGRERKIVFVFGFDESYFDFFAQDKNRMSCPPELYVAITRASEILCIIEHDKNESLSFLKVNPDYFYMHSQYIEYYHNTKNNNKDNKNNKKEIKDKNKEKTKIHNTSVNDLTMYLSEMTMRQLSQMIRVNMLFDIITPPQEKYTVDIPSNVTMKNGLVEDVSDLNGLVIPAIYEANIIDGKSSIQKIVENYCSNATKENRAYIDNKKKELIKHQKNPISIYLILGNLYIALTENILSKLNQINKYDWLSADIIKICHKNIKNNISKEAKYEQLITNNNHNTFDYEHKKYGLISITSRIDAIDDESLWEIRCTSNLNIEHMMQLIIFAWMWEQSKSDKKKYKIINIRTGEVRELKYNDFIIKEIMELIFINKYEQKTKDNDIMFLEKCKKMRRKYDDRDYEVFL